MKQYAILRNNKIVDWIGTSIIDGIGVELTELHIGNINKQFKQKEDDIIEIVEIEPFEGNLHIIFLESTFRNIIYNYINAKN